MTFTRIFKKQEPDTLPEKTETCAWRNFSTILNKLYSNDSSSWKLYENSAPEAWEDVTENNEDNIALKAQFDALITVRGWLAKHDHAKSAEKSAINIMHEANARLQKRHGASATTTDNNQNVDQIPLLANDDTSVEADEVLEKVIPALTTLISNIKYKNSDNSTVGKTELSWELLLGSAVMFINNLQKHITPYANNQANPGAGALMLNIGHLQSRDELTAAFDGKARTARGQAIERATTEITHYHLKKQPLAPSVIAKMYQTEGATRPKTEYRKAAPHYLRQQMREQLLKQMSLQVARYQAQANEETKESTREKLLNKSQSITKAIQLINENDAIGIDTPLFSSLHTAMMQPTKPVESAVGNNAIGHSDTLELVSSDDDEAQSPAEEGTDNNNAATTAAPKTPRTSENQLAAPSPTTPSKVFNDPRQTTRAALADIAGIKRSRTTETVVRNTIEQLLTTHQGSPLKHYQILKALYGSGAMLQTVSNPLNGYMDNLANEIYLLRKATFTFIGEIAGISTVEGLPPSAQEKHEAFCLLASHAEKRQLPDNSAAYAALFFMLSTVDGKAFDALKTYSQKNFPVAHKLLKNLSLHDAKDHYEQKITADQRSRVMQDLLELYITEPKITASTNQTDDEHAIKFCVAFNAAMMPTADNDNNKLAIQVLERPQAQPLVSGANKKTAAQTSIASDSIAIALDAVLQALSTESESSAESEQKVTAKTPRITKLSPQLQAAMRLTGTSANPLQSLTNLAADLLAQADHLMLVIFMEELVKRINIEFAHNKNAITPLMELFAHVRTLTRQDESDPASITTTYNEIVRLGNSDAESAVTLNDTIGALSTATDRLIQRANCALQFINAAQNAIPLFKSHNNHEMAEQWLSLIYVQLDLVSNTYLPGAENLGTKCHELRLNSLKKQSKKSKSEEARKHTIKQASIEQISDIADQCAKETTSRWLSSFPEHKALIDSSKRTLCPRNLDFHATLNLIYKESKNDFATVEYIIIKAIFNHFPRNNSASSMTDYLSKPIAWLVNHRDGDATLSQLESSLNTLIGQGGAAKNIENYIKLIEYYGLANNDEAPKNSDAAYLIADFVLKNPQLFEAIDIDNKASLNNALQKTKILRAATMPEIRDRAFDEVNNDGKTPLELLSTEQLTDYIEGISLGSVASTHQPSVAAPVKNTFYIWCYLTRGASQDKLKELEIIFNNLMTNAGTLQAIQAILKTLTPSQNTTPVQLYLLGQAFAVTQGRESSNFSEQTCDQIAGLFAAIPLNETELLNVTSLNDHETGKTDRENITKVFSFFLKMSVGNIQQLLTYMPAIELIFTKIRTHALNISDNPDDKTVATLWQALHSCLCQLFNIKISNPQTQAYTKIAEVFDALTGDQKNTLQYMIETYCAITTTSRPRFTSEQQAQQNHCKAFFIYLGQYNQIKGLLGLEDNENINDFVDCLRNSLVTKSDYPRASNDLANLDSLLQPALEAQATALTAEQAHSELTDALAVATAPELTDDKVLTQIRILQNLLQTLENILPDSSAIKKQIAGHLNKIDAVKHLKRHDSRLTPYYRGLIAAINTTCKKEEEAKRQEAATQQLAAPRQEKPALAQVNQLLQDSPEKANALISYLLDQLEYVSSPKDKVSTAQKLATTFLMLYPLSRADNNSRALQDFSGENLPREYIQSLDQLRKLTQASTPKGDDVQKTVADNEHLITKILENCRWLLWQTAAMTDSANNNNDAERLHTFSQKFDGLLPTPNNAQHYDKALGVLDVLAWAKAQDARSKADKKKPARFNLLPETNARYLAGKPLSAYQAYCLYDAKKANKHSDADLIIIEMYVSGYLTYLETAAKYEPVAVARELMEDRQLILRMRMAETVSGFDVALNPQQRDNHATLNFRLCTLLANLEPELEKNGRQSQDLSLLIDYASKNINDKSALIQVVKFKLLQEVYTYNSSKETTVSSMSSLSDSDVSLSSSEEDPRASAKKALNERLTAAANKALKKVDELADAAIEELKVAYPNAFPIEGKDNTKITRKAPTFFTAHTPTISTPNAFVLNKAKETLETVMGRYKFVGKKGANSLTDLRYDNRESAAEKLSLAISQVTQAYQDMPALIGYTHR